MRRGEIETRFDGNYWASTRQFNERYAAARYPLAELGESALAIQYGCSDLANEDGRGLRMVRMNNLHGEEWDFANVKHVPLSLREARRYRLRRGDLLFNRTNSKELVGKCGVFDERGIWVFASYLIRVRLDESKLLPQFAALFLNSSAGRIQIDRVSRQIIGMTNVNAEELRELAIPIPPIGKQRELVDAMQAARAARRAKLAEADALLAGMDAFLLETLGLSAPPDTLRKAFAVRAGQLSGRRLDPPAYQPMIGPSRGGTTTLCDLQTLADIDSHERERPESDDAIVPYVGLPECDLTEVREVAMRPYHEVAGRSIARPGDILFARIEPSVFNKKYVLAENLRGHDFAYTSTEFYVVTPKADRVVADYLYAMFFCSYVFAQAKGKTTGSSGRRRLDPQMFRTLQIPLPDRAIQQTIAAEFRSRRERARMLRTQAESGWAEAKRWFEEQLLGPSP